MGIFSYLRPKENKALFKPHEGGRKNIFFAKCIEIDIVENS